MGKPLVPGSTVIWLLILACLSSPANAQAGETRYLVLLDEPSVAERVIASGIALSPGLRRGLATDPNWAGYRARLEDAQQELASRLAGGAPAPDGSRQLRVSGPRVLERRAFLLNILVVSASEEERSRLLAEPGVRQVVAVELREPLLDAAPALLNAPEAWEALGGPGEAGRGVRIAIIDSGINQNHPMFDDTDLEFPPGFPLPGQNPGFVNRKVILARSYHALFPNPQPNTTPEDETGHGTRGASVAAGRQATAPLGQVSGVAPMAWLGSYKVFGTPAINPSATNASVTLAINDAVADGMDVINLSLGGNPRPPRTDPEQEAIRIASELGVIVVISAGNSGPGPGTVKSPGTSPEAITVGAVTNAREFQSALSVSSTPEPPALLQQVPYIPGAGVTIDPAIGPLPVFSAANVDPTEEACAPLPPTSFSGRIALIRRGNCTFQSKVSHAAAAGASAVVVYNNLSGEGPIRMSFDTSAAVPAVMIGNPEGEALRDWLLTVPSQVQVNATADLQAFPAAADLLAGFSSRGPSVIHEVKPDVSAVGQGIYSASNDGVSYRRDSSGTSFSSPLVAGAAALFRQLHPDWPVARIKSALVNSAVQTPLWAGGPASVNQTGSGRLDLDRALRADVALEPVSLSFGFVRGSALGLTHLRTLRLRNLRPVEQTLTLAYEPLRGSDTVDVFLSATTVHLAPLAIAEVQVEVELVQPTASSTFEGYLRLAQQNGLQLTAPLWGGLVVPDDTVSLRVGPGSGFATLEAALAVAAPGNVISVEAGTYTVNLEMGLNAAELPLDAVAVVAAGPERPLLRALSQGDPVIDIRGVEDFHLEGLRLQGGDRSVEVTDASGFLVDNIFESTAAGSFGVDANRSEVGLLDNVIRDIRGSAVALFDSRALLVGNRIGGAAAADGVDRHGLFMQDSSAALFGDVIRGAGRSAATPGVRALRSAALLKGVLVEDTAGISGDGLQLSGSSDGVEVRDSLIRANGRHGLFAFDRADVTLERTRLETNADRGLWISGSSRVNGQAVEIRDGFRGVHLFGSELRLASSIVSGAAEQGLFASQAILELSNVTVAGNQGIGLQLDAPAATAVVNSILAGNATADVEGADGADFFSNLIADGQLAGVNGNMAAAPAFDGSAPAEFTLAPASPGVDTGDTTLLGHDADVAGHLRVVDGNGDGQPVVDRGAREFGSPFAAAVIAPVLGGAPGEFSGLAFTNSAQPELGGGQGPLTQEPAQLRLRGYGSTGAPLGETSLPVARGQQAATLATEVFDPSPAWIEVSSPDPDLMGFTLLGNYDLTLMDGAQLGPATSSRLLFPETGSPERQAVLRIFNPNDTEVALTLTHSAGPQAQQVLGPRGALDGTVEQLFGAVPAGYVEVEAFPALPIAGLETFGDSEAVGGLWGLDPDAAGSDLFAAHFATGPLVTTTLNIVNLGPAGTVRLDAFAENGAHLATVEVDMDPAGQLREGVAELFELGDFDGTGWVRIQSETALLTGALSFEGTDGRFLAALPLQSSGAREFVFSHVAHTPQIFTGVTLLNPTEKAALLVIEVFDRDGARVARTVRRLPAGGKEARLLDEWIPGFEQQLNGFIRVRSNVGLAGFELFGAWDLEFLAAVPQQVVVR